VTESRSVIVSRSDHARLLALLEKSDPASVELLYDELDRATVVEDRERPDDVVAMGSVVTFEDVRTGERSKVELVYPHEADAGRDRISILAPVGAALIGLREGETIDWPVPRGSVRSLRVIAVAPPGGDEEAG
jgi:regulator of nucleoside diphosphate kinase